MVSQDQPVSKCLRPFCYKMLKQIPKSLFLTTSENVNRTSLLQITYNLQLDNIKSEFHAIFIGKYCFYSIFLYNPKSCWIHLVLSFYFFSLVMLKHKCWLFYNHLHHWVNLSVLIFKTLSISNDKSWGADILRKSSPPHTHVSHVMCHMSRVTCHVSHVTFLTFFFFFFTYWWS